MSSSLPTAARAVDLSVNVAGDLLTALREVPDPRPGGARRHPVAYVLGVLTASFACAGFASFTGAAQWATGADPAVLLALGAAPDPLTGAVDPPSEATIRRIACRVDSEALEAVVAAWTAAQLATGPVDGGGGDDDGSRRVPVAVDGKTVRGARTGAGTAPHLLAAATHDSSVVLAQRQVPGKTNEIPMVPALLADLRAAGHDPAGMVFTLDALHTQQHTAALLHAAGAGYLMTVKGNQPGLLDAVTDRLRAEPPTPGSDQRSRGHARTEQRILRAAPATGIAFPGAAQIFRVVRYTGGLDGQRTRKEVVHGITNLRADQADPDQLAALVRGHWSIENSIHWVRDVTYREDASRARTGNAPAVLAAIRNVVNTALRLSGATNIAAARRAATLNPHSIIQLFTQVRNQGKRSL